MSAIWSSLSPLTSRKVEAVSEPLPHSAQPDDGMEDPWEPWKLGFVSHLWLSHSSTLQKTEKALGCLLQKTSQSPEEREQLQGCRKVTTVCVCGGGEHVMTLKMPEIKFLTHLWGVISSPYHQSLGQNSIQGLGLLYGTSKNQVYLQSFLLVLPQQLSA